MCLWNTRAREDQVQLTCLERGEILNMTYESTADAFVQVQSKCSVRNIDPTSGCNF